MRPFHFKLYPMAHDIPLHKRRRAPLPGELEGIPWLELLQPEERALAISELQWVDALPGDYVCRVGRPVTYWFGVVEGQIGRASCRERVSLVV